MWFSPRSALAALFIAVVAPARSAAIGVPGSHEAGKALSHGISFLKRMLHVVQGDEVVSHSIALSRREATLELELAGGGTRTISLRSGDLLVDGRRAGSYQPGGALDRSWRRVLAEGGASDVRGLLASLRAWRPIGLKGADLGARAQLGQALRGLGARAEAAAAAAAPATQGADTGRRSAMGARRKAVTITGEDLATLDTIRREVTGLEDLGPDIAAAVRSGVHLGDYTVPAGEHESGDVVVFKGKADVFGDVAGNVVALYGDVVYHRGATIGKSAVSIGGQVIDDGGTVRGDIKTVSAGELEAGPVPGEEQRAAEAAPFPGRGEPSAWQRLRRDVLSVCGVFVALAMIGFGTVFFGRRYVEVVADTASHSFGRSLTVGLLGQLLVLPTFGMLIVGLVLTVVGILLLPFAAVAFVIGAIAAVLGGYLAVAHAVGETVARRRMAHGAFVRAPNAYGYLFTGLIGLLGLWAAAALFGWAGPVVLLFRIAAVIVTWLAATVGFGAVLLSRGGLRETFAGRHVGELSDEYLWATPPATPAAPRAPRGG